MKKRINIGNSICSTSLFHFTKNKATFAKILKNGLRYSYSVEFNPESIPQNRDRKGIAIPIICFCDIPLLRIGTHVQQYGSYGIGLNKSFLIDKLQETINPIIYVNSDEILHSLVKLKAFAEGYKDIGISEIAKNPLSILTDNKFLEGNKLLNCIKNLYAYFKPSQYNGTDYTKEREWRAILKENLEKGISWNIDSSLKEYKDIKGKTRTVAKTSCALYNDYIGDDPKFHLQFPENEIVQVVDYIIVPNLKQKEKLVQFISSTKRLLGSMIVSDDIRKILISRICCFEQLENDF